MVNSKVLLITSTGVDGGVKIYKITIPNSNSLSRQNFHFSANDPYTVTEGQDSDTITLKNPTFNFSLTSKFTPGKIIINGVNTNQDSVINYPIMRNTTVTATAVTIDKNNFPLNYYARDCIDNYASISSLSNDTITELTNITPMPDASYAFSGCSNLTTLNDVYTTWDMSNVTDISYMFDGCSSLEELDLSDWDLSKVTTSTGFSNGCSSLTDLKLSGNISSDTLSNITSGLKTNTSSPFYLDLSDATCSISETQFKDYTGLKEIDVGPNVTLANNGATQQVFDNCQNIERIDVTQLNVSNAQYLRCMFRDLKKLTSLDLSTWNTKNVRYFSSSSTDGMFRGCTALKVLDISNFDSTTNVGYSYYYIWGTFYNTPAMEYLILGSPTYKFKTQHNHECGNLNTTCKILVPGNLLNTYRNVDRWNERPTQFYPIENYTITRSRGQVSVTPKQLTELDFSGNSYSITCSCSINVVKNWIYIKILDSSNNELNNLPDYLFIKVTDVTNNTSTEWVLAEKITLSQVTGNYHYRAVLNFDLNSDNSYTVQIVTQEVPNFSIVASQDISVNLETTTTTFTSTPPNILGIEYNKTNYSWSRIDYNGSDASSLTSTDIDSHPIFSNIESVTIDDCDMVKIPKFYYLYQKTGNGHRWWISDTQFSINYIGTAKVHPAFIYNGVEKDYFYASAYEGSTDPNDNSKLCSRSGVTPLMYKTITQLRELAEARNVNGVTGFSVINIYQIAALQMLFLLDLGNPNAQVLIGSGRQSSSLVSTGSSNAIWRGIYEFWGNSATMVLGIENRNGRYYLWNNNTDETFIPDNITELPGTGYISDISPKLAEEKGLFLPIASQSSNTNSMFGDYVATNNNQINVCYHGGNYYEGDKCGVFMLYFNYPITQTHNSVGARLVKY